MINAITRSWLASAVLAVGALATPSVSLAQPPGVHADDATRYLALGDSIAAGYKVVPVTQAYPYLLYQDGVFDHIPSTLFCNAAVPGATSQDVLLHQVPQALIPLADGGFNPKYVTLTVGGNDLLAILRFAATHHDPAETVQFANQVLGAYARNLAACGESQSVVKFGIDTGDHSYYTVAHGHGCSRRRAIAAVDRDRGLAEIAGPSVLYAAECVAGRQPVRSVRRDGVSALLREADGTAKPDARPLLPVAVARLLRGHRLGTGHCLTGDRLVGHSQFSRARRERGHARSFDDVSNASLDRRRDAPCRLHVGAATTRRGRAAEGENDRHRCDHARSQRGDAQHRPARHR